MCLGAQLMARSTAQRMSEATTQSVPHSWALLKAQGEIIDAMADGVSLFDTLERIAALVESVTPPALCSILLLDRDRKSLRTGAAPSLPSAYREAADGIQIGPSAGSCGTAAFLGQ